MSIHLLVSPGITANVYSQIGLVQSGRENLIIFSPAIREAISLCHQFNIPSVVRASQPEPLSK